jgi:hypothetical protein
VRPGSGYKVVTSNGTQNYAVKEDHLIFYDDVRSLKEKVLLHIFFFFNNYKYGFSPSVAVVQLDWWGRAHFEHMGRRLSE